MFLDLAVMREYSTIIKKADVIVLQTGMNKSLRVAVSGSHRNGKTELTKKLSDKMGVPYIDANVSASFESMKFSPDSYFTFGERVSIQKVVFQNMKNILDFYSGKMNSYLFDRSPVDMIGYLLANIDQTTSSIFDKDVKEFIQSCISLTREHFDLVIFVPTGFDSVTFCEGKNGKVYSSLAYRMAISNVISGVYSDFLDDFKVIKIPGSVSTTDERVDFVLNKLAQ